VALRQTQETEEIIQRIAALDIGKAELSCCVRIPDDDRPGRRMQEVTTHTTMTRSLVSLADHLRALGVTRVVMEATSDYWRSPFYVLEAAGFETWLVNARDVKHLPGRPKSDSIDAVWLCKVAERQMIRPSFVPPADQRRLRDLTRYRVDLVNARTAEMNRVEKLLEDAQIKLSTVASDLFGVSGRAMLAALLAGERDPKRLAQLARATLRRRIPDLEQALTGRFTDHHAYLLGRMLTRIDAATADITDLEEKIATAITPHADLAARLDEIPGIGPHSAHVLIAEIGTDASRFPTAGHLASWAKFTPITLESAGRRKGRTPTGKGNRYLARTLGEAAVGASRTPTFLGARYRRLARRGRKKAVVAVGRSILTIIWQLLTNPDAHFHDLGADYFDRRLNPDRVQRTHIRALEAQGFTVTLTPVT
jgi:transposase